MDDSDTDAVPRWDRTGEAPPAPPAAGKGARRGARRVRKPRLSEEEKEERAAAAKEAATMEYLRLGREHFMQVRLTRV